jgi:hypothetical protein
MHGPSQALFRRRTSTNAAPNRSSAKQTNPVPNKIQKREESDWEVAIGTGFFVDSIDGEDVGRGVGEVIAPGLPETGLKVGTMVGGGVEVYSARAYGVAPISARHASSRPSTSKP